MRISTLTNWAYGVTVLLTGLSGAAFILSAHAADHERASLNQHLQFDAAAEALSVSTEKMTDEARLYAVRGADRHLNAYRHEALVLRSRDQAFERATRLDPEPAERVALEDAQRNILELDRIEAAAVQTAIAGDRAAAQAQLFGPEHERVEAAVVSALEHFEALVSSRTGTEMRQAQTDADQASLVAKIMLSLTAILFLGVLYFILRRRVTLPLIRMTGVVKRLARQDYSVEVPQHRRRDEIGDMNQAIEVFRLNGLERERLEAERLADQRVKDGILSMMHRLQACGTREELSEVVACFAPQAFPDLAGRLYVLDEHRNALAATGSWLEPRHSQESFPPSACWGLRRGRPHVSNGDDHDIACLHIDDAHVQALCVPLMAQGDTIGLLYFEERSDAEAHKAQRVFLDLMSENVALALANLRLRERLSDLVVRDALTGLFNRRSLDAALVRPAQDGRSLACVMLDIDHFKHFNDTFGHDAGDAVMQHVAQIMRETVGEHGSAYRFGGEEFTVLLPGLDRTAALEVAERLRAHVAAAQLAHHGRMLGHVTISLGLAVSPDDGPPATLLQRADAALLQAKAAGRDRVVTAASAAAIPDQRRAEM